MMNIAMIGFGNAVVNYHLPYLAGREGIKVKTIFRREEDRVGDMEREAYYPDIAFTSDLNAVLSDLDIELIVVATHVDSHFEYARLALEHGKHVLVEKPLPPPREKRAVFLSLQNGKT